MQAWEKFLDQQEALLGSETVNNWLRTLKVTRYDAANLYLLAKDSFQILWFEEHFRKKVEAEFVNNNQRPIKIHLSLNGEATPKKKSSKKQEKIPVLQKFTVSFDTLDPHCTFQNFASTAAHALPYKLLTQLKNSAEHATYNPVYLCGTSGTGKTHLLMATANALRDLNLSIVYVRAETFTEHVVTAIRAGEMRLFRQSYRNADVLIVDDVHLFAKKWATQEEFFHTFNTLHMAGKQIILSANCSPSQLTEIEPRLISRFEWGIVIPIEPIQHSETKKILEAKAKAMNCSLNSKVSEFLLDTFTSSTKSLCRALEALILRSHLNPDNSVTTNQISLPYAQKQLFDLMQEEQHSALTPPKIVQQVADFFGIKPEDILGKAQNRECVLPRHLAMYLCRTQLNLAFTKIGTVFSKDHSTVMSSVKIVQQAVESNNIDITAPLQAVLKKLKV